MVLERKWTIRLSVTTVILAASIAVSLLVSPWFFFVLLIFPFELLLPWMRRKGPEEAH